MAENPSAEASTLFNTAISQLECAVNRNVILGELGSRCAYVPPLRTIVGETSHSYRRYSIELYR